MSDDPDAESTSEGQPEHDHRPALDDSTTGFAAMPGSGKGAVVLLWVMFGLGVCSGYAAIVGVLMTFFTLTVDQTLVDPSNEFWYLVLLLLGLTQAVVWTVFRGIFAVRIPRRSKSARSYAVRLEVIGIVLTVLFQYALVKVSGGYIQQSSTLGFALSCITIGLLATKDLKMWCHR